MYASVPTEADELGRLRLLRTANGVVMKLESRWGLLAAACSGLALALWLGRRDRAGAAGLANVHLHEWENEGGTLASASHPSRAPAPPRS